MLNAMDSGAAAAAPWLVLGFVLGVVVLTLVGLGVAWARRRRRADPDREPAPVVVVDDLPGFLESPPGTAAAATAGSGWASLAPPPPAAPPPAPEPDRGATLVPLAALAMAGLVLLGIAAALAIGRQPAPSTSSSASSAPDAGALEARLAFGGLVLEPRAVGVTATYPAVEIRSDGEDATASVELPTFNCLADEAPDDPVAAGCRRTPSEYAELSSPELSVERDGDGWVVSGRFPTYLHPNGSAPVPTGRSYDLRMTVVVDGPAIEHWQPAAAVLHLGDDRTESLAGDVSVLRAGS